MHRTLIGNLQQSRSVFFGQPLAFHGNDALDLVEHGTLSLIDLATFFAVLFVDLVVPQNDRHVGQGKLLAIRVHAQRHDRAGAQGREQQIVGTRA
eukprot:scaffold286_cov169-Amphora_coffeaeformis.AAC.28